MNGGGPTRLVATVLAVGVAVFVCRRRHDLPTVLTMCGVVFFLRVLFETELNWYYLWPVAALCLLLVARRTGGRLALCGAAVFASIVLGNHNTVHHIVLWWPALMASLVVMLASASWTSTRSALNHREVQDRSGLDGPEKIVVLQAGLPAD
jgi:hypothetical protein